MALLGLGQTLALEGAKHDIKVNTIAPIANSRMLSSILPPDVCKHFRPEAVSALVLALCHETCLESGGAYELGAGWYSKLRWQRTKGLCMDPTKVNAKPEALRNSHYIYMNNALGVWGLGVKLRNCHYIYMNNALGV
jgi:3-hydroxyacyl-CoA dehydrogenase/3a,7a,12a-trihydroxy-5b-cholest-24-enoyl-CoA hydratase